jgi:hypothetical protein
MHYFLIIWVAVNSPLSAATGRVISKTEYASLAACTEALVKEKTDNKQCIPATPENLPWLNKKIVP